MSKRSRSRSSILDTNSEELRIAKKSKAAPEPVELSAGERRRLTEKRSKLYIWCVIGISIALAAFIILRGTISVNEGLTSELVVYDTDITGVADGTYEGQFTNAHMSATVSVDIYNSKITAIQLDSYTGIDPQRAQTVFGRIIESQSVVTDDRSIGSEHTDKIVQRAVMSALSQAVTYTAQSLASQAQQTEASQPQN